MLFFFKKVISFFSILCLFPMSCIFSLCSNLITLESALLSVFHSLVVLLSGAAAVMCFLSEKIYRHISLLDRHNEPPGFPKKKLHVLLERFSLSLHVTLRLSPQYITMIRYKCKPLPVIGIALIPRLNSQVLSDYMVLQ